MKKSLLFTAVMAAALFLCLALIPGSKAAADTASMVTVKSIDYETLEMKINKNGNTIVYLSTDNKKTWNEINGVTDSDGYLTMDISFASATADVDLYLKGNKNMNVLKVTLPKRTSTFKAKFDKINDEIEFTGYEDRAGFYWRKSTDYNWSYVSFSSNGSDGLEAFYSLIPAWRFKGTKIVVKLAQVAAGEINTSGDDAGERPGSEVTVTISKYAAAPSMTLNITKLTLNTKDTLEYQIEGSGTWTTCSKNMLLEDFVPDIVGGTASSPVTILFRTAATEKKAVSLTSSITIPLRKAAPTVGDKSSDVTFTTSETALLMTFNTASKTNCFEYCVDTDGEYEESTAKWRTVTAAKTVKLSAKSAPSGTDIYIRFKGTAANATKNISLALPSMTVCYTVP